MTETPVLVITGAARRIGARIARRFHERGFKLVLHYHRSGEAAQMLVDDLNQATPDSACAIQGDLCDHVMVENLAAQALAAFGRVDVLVNNASQFYPTDFGDSTQAQWDELIDSNLRSAYFISQALSRELSGRQGNIVNIVDTHADRPLARYPIYSIAKAGLKAMTKSLAIELAPEVRVNGVAPGAILWPSQLENDEDPEVLEARQKILRQIPLNTLGDPDHIAATVHFLATGAHYVTGQVIRVDGGRALA